LNHSSIKKNQSKKYDFIFFFWIEIDSFFFSHSWFFKPMSKSAGSEEPLTDDHGSAFDNGQDSDETLDSLETKANQIRSELKQALFPMDSMNEVIIGLSGIDSQASDYSSPLEWFNARAETLTGSEMDATSRFLQPYL
jgi:hypothetical protein